MVRLSKVDALAIAVATIAGICAIRAVTEALASAFAWLLVAVQ